MCNRELVGRVPCFLMQEPKLSFFRYLENFLQRQFSTAAVWGCSPYFVCLRINGYPFCPVWGLNIYRHLHYLINKNYLEKNMSIQMWFTLLWSSSNLTSTWERFEVEPDMISSKCSASFTRPLRRWSINSLKSFLKVIYFLKLCKKFVLGCERTFTRTIRHLHSL